MSRLTRIDAGLVGAGLVGMMLVHRFVDAVIGSRPFVKRLILLTGLVALLPINLSAADAVSPLTAVAELTLNHRPDQSKVIPDGEPVFGNYLGSGDGAATGVLSGRIGWDLYEDQTRTNAHPTLFRGLIEKDGKSHPFEIVGVFTPEPAHGPEELQRWSLSGAIVFETDALTGARHAPITGEGVRRAQDGWRHRYTVWAN